MNNKQLEGESDISDIAEDDQEQVNSNLVVFPKRIALSNECLIDEETFQKVKKLLTCPICLEIFVDPVYVKTCSHRFCKACIERCLRASVKNKQCPSCRQAISTKRVLKEDLHVSSIIQKIFPNINVYKQKEQEIQDKQFEKLYHIKKECSIIQHKRTISKRQEIASNEESISKKVHKEESSIPKENLNQSSNEQLELEQEILNEWKKVPDIQHEDLAEVMKLLQKDEIKINFILTVRLIAKPEDILTKQIEPECIRTSSAITFAEIKHFLCSRLNLKAKKYEKYFRL